MTDDTTRGDMTVDYRPMQWLVGCNVPGYLPESDPAMFDDYATAASYLADVVTDLVDWVASSAESDVPLDEWRQYVGEGYDLAAEALALPAGAEVSWHVGDPWSIGQLGWSVWLVPVEVAS